MWRHPIPLCRSGEIGRHVGFKIRFSQESAGSSPAFGTKQRIALYSKALPQL